MNIEKKYNILVWTVVALAALSLSMLVTIAWHVYISGKSQPQTIVTDNQPENDVVKFSGRYFRDKLDLTPGQMDEFREINHVFRQQARDITIEMSEKRTAMLTEMAKNNSDTATLNNLSEDIGKLHSKLKKQTYWFYLNIKQICDDKQKVKLEQLFKEYFISDTPVQPHGQGMKRRWKNGKIRNN